MAAKAETNILPWLTLREALERVGFEVLRPYLHAGRISARHRKLYTSPSGEERSDHGDTPPAWWANCHIDRAGQVTFFLAPVVVDGRVIDEVVYAYAIDIELDPAAFERDFPAAIEPAESGGMRAGPESILEQNAEAGAKPHPGGRKPVVDWKMVEEEVVRLMEHHGEFSPDDDQWNAQARLEETVADFCQDTFKKLPGETQIREHIRPALECWRRSRSET